eukprot:Nk52_evm1s1854 gene=Nk52_evmTU1s1854
MGVPKLSNSPALKPLSRRNSDNVTIPGRRASLSLSIETETAAPTLMLGSPSSSSAPHRSSPDGRAVAGEMNVSMADEKTGLLQDAGSYGLDGGPSGSPGGHVSDKDFVEDWGSEIKCTWRLAWPVILTYVLQICPGMINVMFLGHLGTDELAASTLGTMYVNVTGFSVGLGLATAMDTLCSQAFGANNKRLLGIILQRGLLILLCTCVPVAFIWWFAEPILLFFSQPPAVAHLSGVFIRLSLPGLYPLFVYEVLKKYLQTQGIVKPSMYIAILSNLYNIFANWTLIYGVGLGFRGAPLARASCNWMMVILTLCYIRFSGVHKDSWTGWSKEAFSKWGQFLNLAVPGMLMTCSEWWAFEVLTIAVGIMGTIQLNAQSIILQVIAFSFMAPLGVAVSATIRVGKFLGMARPRAARHSALASLLLIFCIQIATSMALILLRYKIPMIYTQSQEAINHAAHVIPIVAGFQLFDGLQGVCAGILRGCGRQKVGALLNTICYYFVGIPVGLLFAFTFNGGLPGLWWGMFIALFFVSAAAVALIVRTDWSSQSEKAVNRVRANAG